ncbi:permease [Thermodesulfatator autotrophicus]|uniref:Permease n=1 Tax=Thermodesulfatator autotrophicus TaxID=1795632 RepID=A0A177E6X3_9BACT|nr:permease [Thermodesulfatator autotrophicus]OAG27251.1 permease [Thermodesulfatator autotrophicus]
MNWRREVLNILLGLTLFAVFYFLPVPKRFLQGVKEGVLLAHWYAQEHVIFCLIPAFFIAGAISCFLSKESVTRYLGPQAPKALSYAVASVAGAILAVCSCTVLPLFAGIYLNGAGLGPATTFLYSGPAINVLAIILTARILGIDLGIARGIAAIMTGILIGLLMAALFRKEEKERMASFEVQGEPPKRPLWQNILFLGTLVLILVLATWGKGSGILALIYQWKWILLALVSGALLVQLRLLFQVSLNWLAVIVITVLLAEILFPGHKISFLAGTIAFSLSLFFTGGEAREWFEASYLLARQILPLLFFGVLAAGFFLGRPGHEGFIPSHFVTNLVGGNSLLANFFASVVGAFMYFATLTEVPILQGLLGAGMGKGPALALLLSGPAVSLPNMLVIRSILGTKKTFAFVTLVIIIATVSGFLFGKFF